AIFSIARLPVPAYSEMVKRQALKFIPLDSASVQALQQRSPLYIAVDIKDYYPSYVRSVQALGLPGPLVTRDDMSPDVVYQTLKIVYSRMSELRKMNDGFRGESPTTELRGRAIPLHPGAETYFKEFEVGKQPVSAVDMISNNAINAWFWFFCALWLPWAHPVAGQELKSIRISLSLG